MEAILLFAGEHPVVAVLIVWSVCHLLGLIIQQPFRLMNRYFRSRNIREHGWPTPPMDADGDVILPKDIKA